MSLSQFARLHIAFLRAAHRLGVSTTRPTRESLRRYTELWLPLVAKRPLEPMVPPADVAWLWHCHRLAPGRYTAFIKGRFNINVLDPYCPFTLQPLPLEMQGYDAQRAQAAWAEAYGTAEPFHLSQQAADQRAPPTAAEQGVDGYDLAGSCMRQSTVLYHISVPVFEVDE